MVGTNKFRGWLSANLAPTVFLMAYFFTVVLGSFMYMLPSARPYLEMARFTSRIFEFDSLFSAGYWVLLLSPFVVTPLIVWAVRRLAQRPLNRIVEFFPEFTRTSYTVLLLLCYAMVFYAFWRADAFKLFLEGRDFASSVEARFEIRERVSFFSMAVLMSNLHFLSIYAAVKWVRQGGFWWGGVTIFNAVVISVLLISLNMKWPIIIFYAGMVMALFVYTRRYPFIKTAVGMVALLLVYFLISAFVYRLAPPVSDTKEAVAIESHIGAEPTVELPRAKSSPVEPEIHAHEKTHVDGVTQEREPDVRPNVVSPGQVDSGTSRVEAIKPQDVQANTNVIEMSAAIGAHVPQMMFHAVNRMAIIYPYYYEIFTSRGQVCGGLMAQAQVGQKCRPSYFIYTEMFNDQFNGRGTAPAAVHITAYALGGWTLAAVGLLCASLLLGVFASLPLSSNSMVGAMAITGGVVGYHLSQLPGEGPLFYDHGVFWTIVMLFGYAVLVKAYRRLAKK